MKTKLTLTTLLFLLPIGCTTLNTHSTEPTSKVDTYHICRLNPHATIIGEDGEKKPCSELGIRMVDHPRI